MIVDSITLPPQFDPDSYEPDFDGTGVNASNLVENEIQVFEPNEDSPHTFIMPSFAPFFATGMVVELKNNVDVYVPMTHGSQYTFCFPFLGGSRALDKALFGGIVFHTLTEEADVRLRYQTLGGEWVTGQVQNAAILAAEERHPGSVALEQAAAFTVAFPIIGQPWDRQDPIDMVAVVAKINAIAGRIKDRYLELDYEAALSHLGQLNNPHGVDKVDLNLGLVVNLGPASGTSSRNPVNDEEYVNTAQANAMMLDWVYSAGVTQQGVSKLNLGINPGDDVNSTDSLTAAGFSAITANPNSAINQAYNKGQVERAVTPFPFVFPILWNSVQYEDVAGFVQGVQTTVGVSPLEYNENNGVFWFPANTLIPDLEVTEV